MPSYKDDPFIVKVLGPVLQLAVAPIAIAVERLSVTAEQQRLQLARGAFIGDVKQGQTVAITGTVVRGQPLRGPISHSTCVAFSVSTRRLLSDRASAAVDFEIEDETGCAVVHASEARLILKDAPSQTRRFGPYDDAGEWLGQWQGSFFRPVVIAERTLSIGDRVTVLGFADWRPDGQAAYRDAPPRLHISKPARSRVLIERLAVR